MSDTSDAIHEHHQALMAAFDGHVTAILAGRPDADPTALLQLLEQDLLPHAVGEERFLYPALDRLLRHHGRATATMSVDHEFLEEYVRQIRVTVQALAAAPTADHAGLRAHLERLCLQLQAVMQLHLEKEERLYLPLFEQLVEADEQRRILAGMHEVHTERPAAPPAVLDVRTLLPAQRHEWILDTFSALQPGELFILVSDRDTNPLYYEFQAGWAGAFTWEDLELGPEIWRVRLGQPGAVASGIDPSLIILSH